MSIHFISGKPGGGKSMYAVKLLIQELRSTDRDIVTNLPLKLGDLAMYLEREFGETFNMHERIQLIAEDQLAEFFLHRGNGRRLDDRIEQEVRGRRKNVVDYSKAAEWGGVFYVIDEIHIAFNARKWAETGDDCIYYLSQHRKLGDDVICCTQHVGNVDKQFRSMAQDYTYLRNMSKEKVGIFRSFPLFQRATYLQPATGNEKAMETAVMRIDVQGLGQVYDTAAGVGIHGRLADTTAKRKGISLAWLFGAVVVGCIGLAFVPRLMGKGAAKMLEASTARSRSAGSNVVNHPPRIAPAIAQTVEKPEQTRKTGAPIAGAGGTNEVSPVYITALLPSYPESGLTVHLSNGETYRMIDGEVKAMGPRGRWVLIGTNRYEWRR